MAKYSRLASVEERRNVRSAFIFILLTIASLVLLFFVGIPVLGRFTAFVSDLGKSTKPIAQNDKTPPPPPKFNTFPDFTNQDRVDVSGSTEPGANVKLTFNGNGQENLADKDGKFSFSLMLTVGDNTFSATAVDAAGNLSQKTPELKIVYDKKPPELTVSSPSDGSQLFGSNQRQITIQGTTDEGSQIIINDRIIAVDAGKFQYTTTLNDGENKFNIKSTDQAGNFSEKNLTLNFTP